MANYEAIYPGATDYLIPSYNTISYNIPISELSVAQDPRTANQLGEINLKLNPGETEFEVQGTMSRVWEAVPEQHLEEINRLAKLTGTKPSLHGPIIEASGISERGWSELDRVGAEKQIESAVLRAQKLDPNGNIPVTIHSTAQLPEMQPIVKTKEGEKIKTLWVVNPDTGKFAPIEPRKRYFPEEGEFAEKPKEFDPHKELKKLNQEQWTEQLSGVNRYASFGEQAMNNAVVLGSERGERKTPEEIQEYLSEVAKIDLEKEKREEIEKMGVKEDIKAIQRHMEEGQIWLREAYRNMKSLFDNTYERASEKDKEELRKFAKWVAPIVKEGIERDPEKMKQFQNIVEKGLRVLGKIENPQMFVPLNDFVIDKSAETFANVATSAFNKFGEKAPILSIENPPAGTGLSKAEDLKKLVEASREKFVENLQKKGLSKSEAEKIAEKTIGATWDVGHINMMRKFGWTDKDLIKETEKISPFVKHIHLSDNFGFEHTELPMGMGNVPLKPMLEKIQKAKGEKEMKKIRKVIEAGDWFQYFAEKGGGHPLKPTIQAFDSPLYAMYAGPRWSQLGGFGAYYMGHGAINPPIHHQTYGAGLTTLPPELGGEMPGPERGRFAQAA